eukprot:CAMPEP_0196997094 /NCGR_PEP_ID=MMETSP1380-20130617/2802_1 /TAXON_ID=5936 /ORGANISM="Euplotes crassus, Strain CT5" /LENGTH=223 /DNA_ID=CAMNT_0042413233 /DNA_START=858 /DNA_END=1529 /DNA_ORIENTATION=-
MISKCLTKSPKERPTAMELCLSIPSTTISNYAPPKVPTLSSLTFMNPTKSTIEREKSTSKSELKDIYRRRQRFNKIDNLEPIRPTRSKYKTPKRSNGQNVSTSYSQICNEASTTQYKSNAKPSEYSKKKILSRLGEMRMREKPFENATIHSHKNNLYLNEFSNISDLRKEKLTSNSKALFNCLIKNYSKSELNKSKEGHAKHKPRMKNLAHRRKTVAGFHKQH